MMFQSVGLGLEPGILWLECREIIPIAPAILPGLKGATSRRFCCSWPIFGLNYYLVVLLNMYKMFLINNDAGWSLGFQVNSSLEFSKWLQK